MVRVRYVARLLLFILASFSLCSSGIAGPKALLTLIEEYNDFILTDADPFRHPSEQPNTSLFTKPRFISAVAARDNHIFFIDSGTSRVFFLDGMMRRVSEFAVLNGGETSGLFLAQDLSLFVIDRINRSVLHYSRDGRLLTRFNRNDVLINPIDVIQDEPLRDVIIADSLGAYLAKFNALGGLHRVIGQNINQESIASSIIAMTAGQEGYYLLDSLSRSVVVIDRNGDILDSLGHGVLKQPVSVATDPCERVFVADQYDNSIHVFIANDLLYTQINQQPGVTGFVLITDIWIDSNILYVADGPGAKIKKYLIDIDC